MVMQSKDIFEYRATKDWPYAISSGCVVYRYVGDELQVLLLKRAAGDFPELSDNDRDTFHLPKGGVERRETLEQTALREITEETGLRSLRIIDQLDKLHFFYRMKGKLIFMTNFVFLIEATDPSEELVPEESEGIIDVRWFDEATARAMIEYKATKVLFDSAIRKIRDLEPKA